MTEKELVNEVMKLFIANGWAITPEGIWGFMQERGNQMGIETVRRIHQKISQESVRR